MSTAQFASSRQSRGYHPRQTQHPADRQPLAPKEQCGAAFGGDIDGKSLIGLGRCHGGIIRKRPDGTSSSHVGDNVDGEAGKTEAGSTGPEGLTMQAGNQFVSWIFAP